MIIVKDGQLHIGKSLINDGPVYTALSLLDRMMPHEKTYMLVELRRVVAEMRKDADWLENELKKRGLLAE